MLNSLYTRLNGINRIRTNKVGVMSETELNQYVTIRNKERKAGNVSFDTIDAMNTKEAAAAYRNNVIEAIERNQSKLYGEVATGGMNTAFIEGLLVELLDILDKVDAKLDLIEKTDAIEVSQPIGEVLQARGVKLEQLSAYKIARKVKNLDEQIALNFDHIPFTSDELQGAKVVRAFNHGEDERFEVIDETSDSLIVVKLRKDGGRYKNRKAFMLYKSHIVEIFVLEDAEGDIIHVPCGVGSVHFELWDNYETNSPHRIEAIKEAAALLKNYDKLFIHFGYEGRTRHEIAAEVFANTMQKLGYTDYTYTIGRNYEFSISNNGKNNGQTKIEKVVLV